MAFMPYERECNYIFNIMDYIKSMKPIAECPECNYIFNIMDYHKQLEEEKEGNY